MGNMEMLQKKKKSMTEHLDFFTEMLLFNRIMVMSVVFTAAASFKRFSYF